MSEFRKGLGNLVEGLIPWHLQPSSLNENEEQMLHEKRTMAPTIDRTSRPAVYAADFKSKGLQGRGEIVATNQPAPARPAPARKGWLSRATNAAGSLYDRYGNEIIAEAETKLQSVTGGKVTSLSDVPNYIGKDPQRASIVAGAASAAGINPRDIIPDDVIGSNPVLAQVMAEAEATFVAMQNKYAAGSDRTLAGPTRKPDTANDVIRRRRVEAVLSVYDTEEKYFLCHPNGGVPVEDFVWYRTVILGRA